MPSYAVQEPKRAANTYWLWAEIDYNESNATHLFTLTARSFVVRSMVYIETAWDGSTPLLSVGSSGSNGLLINGADLSSAGGQSFLTPVMFDAETDINCYPTHDSSTAGQLYLGVEVLDVPRY